MADLLTMSEVVTAMAIKGDISPHTINKEDLMPPYNEIIAGLQEGKTPEDLSKESYLQPIRQSLRALSMFGVGDEVDALELLKTASVRYRAGQLLQPQVRKLESGQPANIVEIQEALDCLHSGTTMDWYSKLEDVNEIAGTYAKSFFKPLDEHIGGLPENAITVIAGLPGTGKTYLATKLALTWLRNHPEDTALIVTLEMTNAQIRDRILGEKTNKSIRERLLVSDGNVDVDKLAARITRLKAEVPNLNIVVVDFIDLLIQGPADPVKMEHIYTTLARTAKQNDIVLIAVAQLNRKNYGGGVPVVTDLRWSGMAEATSALICLLYNPNKTITVVSGKSWLPTRSPENGFMVIGKAKFGTKHENSEVGAIRVKFSEAGSKWINETDFVDDWYAYDPQKASEQYAGRG